MKQVILWNSKRGPHRKCSVDKKQRLFKAINAKQLKFDPSIGANIYCPVCWEQFEPARIESELSIEHVPPASAAKLIGEKGFETLTCTQCNNAYGTKYQNDLKHFLIHQLWQSGEYDGKIPGEVTIPGTSALKCNIIWNRKGIQIIGVPKANNPLTIEKHMSILNRLAETGISNWDIHLEGNLGYRRTNVHNAYLHAAYLMVNIRTGCMYSFSSAGMALRKLFVEKSCSQLGACTIPTKIIGIGSTPWVARVEEPSNLRCIWVKVAGNIVVLPQPDNTDLTTLYEAWQQVSEATDFGLLPRENISFKLAIYTKEELFEAKKCLPSFFGKSSP